MIGSKLVRLVPVALASALVAMLFAPATSAAPAGGAAFASGDLCGTTIMADLVLTQDLVCRGNGLIVGADGIEIRLNGHSITGPSRGPPLRGITIVQRTDVEIEGPGTVTNFRTGILISNSREIELERVTVTNNGLAGFPDGDGIRILASTDVEIENSRITGNGNDGVQVVASTEVEFEKNWIVQNGNGISISGSGFEVERNRFTGNACAVKGSIVGHEFERNRYTENTVDFCA